MEYSVDSLLVHGMFWYRVREFFLKFYFLLILNLNFSYYNFIILILKFYYLLERLRKYKTYEHRILLCRICDSYHKTSPDKHLH